MAKFYLEKIKHLRSLIELSHNGVLKFNIPVSTVNFNRDNVCCMKKLTKTTGVEILKSIKKMKNKSCFSDPISTFILKQCADLLSPVLAYMVNKSFDESNVSSNLKHAIVTPVIKAKNGNQDKYQNYLPVSSLPFVSKLLENIVLDQIQEHLWHNNLYGKYQSGYRQFHSCETALLKVISDIQDGRCFLTAWAMSKSVH